MDSVYFLLALAIILALFWMAKQRRIAAIRHVLNRKRNSGKDKVMEELARQFIGKECIIHTVTSTDSSIQGTVKDVTDGGIVLEKDGNVEAVNLEYVTRIREYPRNAIGLAESHCVKETALDAKKLGYETHVIENLTEPVSEELGVEARRQMREAGVVLD